ncbi:MAG: hypothetical protein VX278_24235 [Myxococcota bacterium]|nr:hypothetical protein [Myxococcota bacterium]
MFWFLLSCTQDDIDYGQRGDCNPVSQTHCLLPFPSDFYLEKDESTPTGNRLTLSSGSLPVNVDNISIDPKYINENDGFSIGSYLTLGLLNASLEGTIAWTNPERYADSDARTVIIEQESGLRVPHFVEREYFALESERSLLLLRPLEPLQYNKRYVVGIRNLVDVQGDAVSAPSGFASLRDQTATDPDLLRQQSLYEEVIFPTLEKEGFTRTQLQLAWSFSTASEEHKLHRIRHILNDAQETSPRNEIEYTVTEVEMEDCPGRGRTIHGTFRAPLYLESWASGSFLTRDDDQLPYQNGWVDVPFLSVVGCKILEDPSPGALLQYGHGVFGNRDEANSDYIHELVNEQGWVVFATEWTGMKRTDSAQIALDLITQPTHFASLTERLHQAWVEFLILSDLMRSEAIQNEPLFQVDGVSLIDPHTLYYYGNSQGAILGGGYVAMHPDIQRAVLGVGGMPWTLILNRSMAMDPFLRAMKTMYEDWADITVMEILFQQLWDATESVGWTYRQNKPILIQAAIGDRSVPPLAAHFMARGYRAKLVEPYHRPIMGLETQPSPFEGSALIEWDYGISDPILSHPGPVSTDPEPHEDLRREPEIQQQIGTFLGSGTVVNYCEEACSSD